MTPSERRRKKEWRKRKMRRRNAAMEVLNQHPSLPATRRSAGTMWTAPDGSRFVWNGDEWLLLNADGTVR